jgi:hypothetical protein
MITQSAKFRKFGFIFVRSRYWLPDISALKPGLQSQVFALGLCDLA